TSTPPKFFPAIFIHILWTTPGDDAVDPFVRWPPRHRRVTSSCPQGRDIAVDNPWTTLWMAGENVVRGTYCGRTAGLSAQSYTAHPPVRIEHGQGGRGLSPDSTPPTT